MRDNFKDRRPDPFHSRPHPVANTVANTVPVVNTTANVNPIASAIANVVTGFGNLFKK